MKTFDEDFFCIENFIVKKECFHYRENNDDKKYLE